MGNLNTQTATASDSGVENQKDNRNEGRLAQIQAVTDMMAKENGS